MFTTILTGIVFTLSLANISTASADEAGMKEWTKYLAGEWTYKVSDGSKGEAKFSFRAKRKAMVGTFKEEGSTAFELGGWRPDRKAVVVTGFGSKGNYWELEYTKIGAKGGVGKIQGAVDGVTFKADFSTKVAGPNAWNWSLIGKTPDGDEVKLSAEFLRKKK